MFIVAGTSLQIPDSLPESKILIFQAICLLAEHLARLVHILEIKFVVLCLPVLALVHNVVVLAFGDSVLSHVALRCWANTDLGTHSALCIFELNVRNIWRDNYGGWFIGRNGSWVVGRKVMLKVIGASHRYLRSGVTRRKGSIVGRQIGIVGVCDWGSHDVSSLYDFRDILSVIDLDPGVPRGSYLAVVDEWVLVVLDGRVDHQSRWVVLLEVIAHYLFKLYL